jgi:N-acetyl-gamma-glutamyl-phosphate reductase
MTRTRVAIIGVSGYSGVELTKLLDAHPAFELVAAVADRWQGRSLGAQLPLSGDAAHVVVQPMTDAVGAVQGAAVVMLATPAEVSARVVPELIARGIRVVDLSGAFRLALPEDYPRWYGFAHPAPDLLREARFGLPEVPAAGGGAPNLRRARIVANPGCYATAAIVALAPLLAAGAIEPHVFVDGKSGVTGAGRKAEERLMFAEVAENVSPYRVGTHQHAPEIELALSRVARREVRVTFVPHLLPVRRGLICTAYARLAEGAPAELQPLMDRFYAHHGQVEVLPPEQVTLSRVVGTTRCAVGARGDAERRSVVSIGALDNLLKGAASQAVQNLCEMVGVPFDREE